MVKLHSSERLIANVDDDSMLHVAANWVSAKNQCLFEMACIRMTSDGQNQMLLEHEILDDKPFTIQVI
ncbi:hypothetical protein CR152_31890 [Massilia violaceinigra]|uniref:Uncharacterized protein n=2 Tax=Massilia violaceinigra TaxID=2045208 RepID=A0A2D2DUG0_9BURK|nr:hypothetical protein CR152_31890 [Massilia violaceinigra]